MASVTLTIPEDLASRIHAHERQLPRILELGLPELNAADQAGFDGAADVLELLAGLPSPEEILSLRPSPSLAARVSLLLEKSRAGAMTLSEEEEWERYEYLEHLVRLAKAAAQMKLAPSAGSMAEIGPALRSTVRSRARGFCEYCGISERFTLAGHEIDHVIAIKHGGVPAET
jgi:hypothetical protein